MNKKKNVDILHIVNLCTYFMTFKRYLLDQSINDFIRIAAYMLD